MQTDPRFPFGFPMVLIVGKFAKSENYIGLQNYSPMF